ncbi:MAG TPA: hypothetical protein VFR67_15855 [Pilimelia sp.]|nr:hypothetical protein [Pilimelia sp.]
MRTRHATLVLSALLLVLTVGCASAEDSPRPGTTGSTPTTPVAPAQSTPADGDVTVPPSTPPKTKGSEPAVGEITVTGKVVAGVEPGCKILQTGDKGYLLVAQGAANQQLQVGATVVVRGEVQPDMVTTCMQGTPLVVKSVDPA